MRFKKFSSPSSQSCFALHFLPIYIVAVDLQIDNNQLTGPIPTEITKIESLEILYLSENLLSGTIPFKELSTMSSLSKLVLFFFAHRWTGQIVLLPYV